MIDFSLASVGNKNDSLANYGPINPSTADQLSSMLTPLFKPYLTLTAFSGDQSGNGVAYYVQQLRLPDSNNSFGQTKRLMYSMRPSAPPDFVPVDALNVDRATNSPFAGLANLSTSQFVYFGPRVRDMFNLSVFDNHIAEWLTIISEQSIAQGCVPFYAKYSDVLEICIACVSGISVNLQLQLANFDAPIWNGNFGGGGFISKSYT